MLSGYTLVGIGSSREHVRGENKKLTVSSVRVKKFCVTTEFDASKVLSTGFKASYTLGKGWHGLWSLSLCIRGRMM